MSPFAWRPRSRLPSIARFPPGDKSDVTGTPNGAATATAAVECENLRATPPSTMLCAVQPLSLSYTFAHYSHNEGTGYWFRDADEEEFPEPNYLFNYLKTCSLFPKVLNDNSGAIHHGDKITRRTYHKVVMLSKFYYKTVAKGVVTRFGMLKCSYILRTKLYKGHITYTLCLIILSWGFIT